MNLNLPKLLPVLAGMLPTLHVWWTHYNASNTEVQHLPRHGEADRIPRPGAYALLSGYVPD